MERHHVWIRRRLAFLIRRPRARRWLAVDQVVGYVYPLGFRLWSGCDAEYVDNGTGNGGIVYRRASYENGVATYWPTRIA